MEDEQVQPNPQPVEDVGKKRKRKRKRTKVKTTEVCLLNHKNAFDTSTVLLTSEFSNIVDGISSEGNTDFLETSLDLLSGGDSRCVSHQKTLSRFLNSDLHKTAPAGQRRLAAIRRTICTVFLLHWILNPPIGRRGNFTQSTVESSLQIRAEIWDLI